MSNLIGAQDKYRNLIMLIDILQGDLGNAQKYFLDTIRDDAFAMSIFYNDEISRLLRKIQELEKELVFRDVPMEKQDKPPCLMCGSTLYEGELFPVNFPEAKQKTRAFIFDKDEDAP